MAEFVAEVERESLAEWVADNTAAQLESCDCELVQQVITRPIGKHIKSHQIHHILWGG